MSRSSKPELVVAADALTTLASIVRSGRSLRVALIEWPAACGHSCPDFLRRVVAVVRAGGSIRDVSGVPTEGPLAAALISALEATALADRHSAGVAAAVLDTHAASLRRRATAEAEAEAGTSGARLSGYLVAGLPIAFFWLVPATARSWGDPATLSMMCAGAALVIGGMRWLSRLLPRAPAEEPAADVARELAALLSTGSTMSNALRTVAGSNAWDPLRRAAGATRLGIGWLEALNHVPDERCRALARILAGGRRVGQATAVELSCFADEVCARSRLDFERRLRRAPVLMVVPLTLCLLPGFALMTLGPFLRELLT